MFTSNDWFYEHRTVLGLTKKVPYFLQLKRQPLFFIPGLYSVADIKQEDGSIEKTWTVGMITREAIENKVMQQIHNSNVEKFRMPLLLPFHFSKKWLNEDLSESEYRQILNFEMPSEEMDYRTVYTIRSQKLRPDGKAKNEFYDWGDKVKEIVL